MNDFKALNISIGSVSVSVSEIYASFNKLIVVLTSELYNGVVVVVIVLVLVRLETTELIKDVVELVLNDFNMLMIASYGVLGLITTRALAFGKRYKWLVPVLDGAGNYKF